MIRTLFLGFLLVFIASCGFQLRGNINYGISSVYIQSEAADIVANQVKQYLTTQPNITLTTSPKNTDVVVLLSEQKLDRRVLSISASSGRLEEVELSFKINVEMRQSDDTILLEQQTLSYIRDYSYNEKAVLAMGAEEELLRKELLQETTLQILRMLQIVSKQVELKSKKP
ncbi:LPS assembly lipoprotein LptE [Candidatus Albibeggiatoa sp. nov. BB20]|uniref:LPS-assembly lipoprotein LptE n=1 Tax=Candidatus Albibeggiatoa sp. nov. BB20 TaxID=3162723 RepID=UPI0033657DED